MNEDIKELLQEQIRLSTEIAEIAEKKTQAYVKQALEYQRYSDELEKQRLIEEHKILEMTKINKVAEERLRILESLVDTIKKLFLDDKTIEKLINGQSIQIKEIVSILHNIAIILQIQASKVIEVMTIDDKTRNEYDKLLKILEAGLHREMNIHNTQTEFNSDKNLNIKANDIIGGNKSGS